MKRVVSRQLQLAFADNPQGGNDAETASVLAGKAYLLHIASARTSTDITAKATSQWLYAVASAPNLASALRHVAQNKGAAGVDGSSVTT